MAQIKLQGFAVARCRVQHPERGGIGVWTVVGLDVGIDVRSVVGIDVGLDVVIDVGLDVGIDVGLD